MNNSKGEVMDLEELVTAGKDGGNAMSKSAPWLNFDILPPSKNSHDECSIEVQSAFRSVLENGKQGI
ncbi:hypothetical protein STEG23_017119 [Scotinomys teguina]